MVKKDWKGLIIGIAIAIGTGIIIIGGIIFIYLKFFGMAQ